MSKLTTATEPASNIDHQRTYCADEAGHSALFDAAGSTISLPGGGRYTLRRQIGPVALDRTLVTWYFDTDRRDLHRSGSMLRWRGKQDADDVVPSKGLLEARVLANGKLQRTSGRECGAMERLPEQDDPAISAVHHLTNGQALVAVATQSKQRRFLFAGSGLLSGWRPDFVVALDQVTLTSHADPTRQASRLETEIQIFTKLPWLRTVDRQRVTRFEVFAGAMEAKFSLEESEDASYQAVPQELLS